MIEKQLSDTDYVVKTPDRRRQSRVCHVNMLKLYRARSSTDPTSDSLVATAVPVAVCSVSTSDEDGLSVRSVAQQTPRLTNSKMLLNLSSLLSHLEQEHASSIVSLVADFKCLFGDVPTCTTVLEHDIDVAGAVPIKQHPYRVNHVKRSVMKQEVAYLLENGLARPSSSPWSSPCILVPKPDSKCEL